VINVTPRKHMGFTCHHLV